MGSEPKGRETFHRMFGPEYSARFIKEINELSPEFSKIVLEILTSEIWSLNKMDLRTKILCAFSSLAALGRPEAEAFAYGAYYHGVTLEQLTEIILVVGIEAGFPAAMEAFKRANSAWEQYHEIKGTAKNSQ